MHWRRVLRWCAGLLSRGKTGLRDPKRLSRIPLTHIKGKAAGTDAGSVYINGKSLTIAGGRVYFDDKGTAQFSPKKAERTAVEQLVREYQVFIEQWLQASGETEPGKIEPEEQEMRSSFKSLVELCRERAYHVDRHDIAELLRNVVKKGRRYPNMIDKQIEEGIADALSNLDLKSHPRSGGTHAHRPGRDVRLSCAIGFFLAATNFTVSFALVRSAR